MTSWTPRLEGRDGPAYLAIASALQDDIKTGSLVPGSRMPTHRDLAYRLGVTVGTISRAYAEATSRGLIDGEVGRGTFVRRRPSRDMGEISSRTMQSGIIDFGLNYPPMSDIETDAMRMTLAEISDGNALGELMSYIPHGGLPRHREAASRWVETLGLPPVSSQAVITGGAQNGMLITFSALCEPGDTVLVDALTYPGMVSLANLLRLRLVPVEMDEFGPDPESFARLCRTHRPAAYYALPTHHNPTMITIPIQRRRRIAEIALAHDTRIVEDDIYRFLEPDAPEPFASIIPDNTVFVTSSAKQLAPGLRIGVVVAPRILLPRIEAVIRTSTWMAAPIMAEVFSRWVDDGTANRLAEVKRKELEARQKLAAKILDGFQCSTAPTGMHLWLRLPEAWGGMVDVVGAAAERSLSISSGEVFAVRPGAGRGYLRLCLGNPAHTSHVEDGLARLADLLSHPPSLGRSIV